jgi:hypothetical protein
MATKNSEILFNKRNLKSPIEQSPITAREILYILGEGLVEQKKEDSLELINLYTKRVNKPSQALSKKISLDEFRPFEFLVNRN